MTQPMNEHEARDATARKWLRQAEHDLSMAERNLSFGGYDVACFLSQQAVEKLLKALHERSAGSVPKTHDLGTLARQLGLDDAFVRRVNLLTGDYMTTRYPDMSIIAPCDLFDCETAAEKLKMAGEIFAQLRTRFEDGGDGA